MKTSVAGGFKGPLKPQWNKSKVRKHLNLSDATDQGFDASTECKSGQGEKSEACRVNLAVICHVNLWLELMFYLIFPR